MMDGFDLESPLVCEGIIGDGCGGGRIFYVKGETLFVYDPTTKESRILVEGLDEVIEVSKKACIIKLTTTKGSKKFDLSKVY